MNKKGGVNYSCERYCSKFNWNELFKCRYTGACRKYRTEYIHYCVGTSRFQQHYYQLRTRNDNYKVSDIVYGADSANNAT